MSFAKVYSAQAALLKAQIVTIETDLSRGLYAFALVGLPDKAVEEARDRMSAAVKNSGFTSPKSKNHKVVISLAPADLKKEGPSFDLGVALSYLLSAGEVHFDPEGKLFLGELALDGELRKVSGVLPCVLEAKKRGFTEVYLPTDNAREAALVDGISIFPASTLRDIIAHVNQKAETTVQLNQQPKTEIVYSPKRHAVDFGDIIGQELGKRALEIAAAGRHNIILYGPPGTGKTMLARAFTDILPPLAFEEALEATAIHSVAGTLTELVTHPPFRSPHHTSSYVSLVGGGAIPKPGEITLAHRGVLFLDEFPEFDRRVIDALREPLEERTVSISRAKGSAVFPASFTLVAAMNPCPCGNFGSTKECVCTPLTLSRYKRKVSGPIVDRIDMWVEVPHVPHEQLTQKRAPTKESGGIKERILHARQMQLERFQGKKIQTNSEMGVRELSNMISLTSEVKTILDSSAKKLDLSPRAYHRVVKLACTIGDLDGAEHITTSHILEALQYRPKLSMYA